MNPLLEQDLRREKLHIEELLVRARRRLEECLREAAAAREAGTEGERRVVKLRALEQRYADLVSELERPSDLLAAEVLLARLQGPEVDILTGEVERNRDAIVQRAAELLRARDHHRSLRQRWGELNERIRALCEYRRVTPPRMAAVDFRVQVTPASVPQGAEGLSYREVADVVRDVGL